MRDYREFYIDGQWVMPKGAREAEVINPANEEIVGVISLGTEEHVDLAVQAARQAFDGWSRTTRDQRLDLLDQVCRAFESKLDEIAKAITEEMGAPLAQLSRPLQAPAGLGHFLTATSILRDYDFEESLGTTRVIREPAGVCGLITPWNWPLNQIAAKVAPALAAGCTMVLKPSEIAPFSAYLLAKIFDEVGVPPGVFNLINGDGPGVGAPLAAHPDVDLVSFTGSTRAGTLVSIAAAPTVKRVALELGGKSANIILDDADLETAVKHGVSTMMLNTGQSCNAPSRMLVPLSRIDEVERLAEQFCKEIMVGDPMNADTNLGPLASAMQYEKVQECIRQGVAEGAKLICGGLGRPEGIESGFFAQPTIFSAVNNQMQIAKEEIFGPVLCIMPYRDDDEAIKIANDSCYGLSGYVSSGSLERARKVAKQLRTGAVHLNGAALDFTAPFGGYKQSGNGREWGKYGFEEFLEIKAVMGYEGS
ncbi:aldehyde dehydrogenase family protein [Stutzerimonas nitrititolerans]|uniref:aldehyde dehydrogenase family protein n=1 Tax=Pseudomonadaceae TaxID=135621 RepID=UPI0007DCCA8C|nr:MULTISPECIES: aldehyde dehydrogenase family protein [Pseudomonadaceae]ANI32712.1 aldehyde dehydrogenase [Pseudomonas sp. JY-Q]MCQ4310076.1 aldehyde dehydrogenase family protein [Stutzerimonas stutzeri]